MAGGDHWSMLLYSINFKVTLTYNIKIRLIKYKQNKKSIFLFIFLTGNILLLDISEHTAAGSKKCHAWQTKMEMVPD